MSLILTDRPEEDTPTYISHKNDCVTVKVWIVFSHQTVHVGIGAKWFIGVQFILVSLK